MDFSDLGKMKEMMGQAKQMQEQMERKLSETVVEASSGGSVSTMAGAFSKERRRARSSRDSKTPGGARSNCLTIGLSKGPSM